MSVPSAKSASVVFAVLGVIALVIEFTVSHGWADLFWFLFAVLLLASSYALQHHSRTVLIYRYLGKRRDEVAEDRNGE